jgi:hypothetical protein
MGLRELGFHELDDTAVFHHHEVHLPALLVANVLELAAMAVAVLDQLQALQ